MKLLAKLTGLIAMDELVELARFATGWITQTTPSHDLSYSVDLFKYIFVTQIKQIKYIWNDLTFEIHSNKLEFIWFEQNLGLLKSLE